jgi:hypothetical protein
MAFTVTDVVCIANQEPKCLYVSLNIFGICEFMGFGSLRPLGHFVGSFCASMLILSINLTFFRHLPLNKATLSSLCSNSDVWNLLFFLFLLLFLIAVRIYSGYIQHRNFCPCCNTANKFRDHLFYLSAYSTKGTKRRPARLNLMRYSHYVYAHIDKDLNSLWKFGKRLIDIFLPPELLEKKFLQSLPDWKLHGQRYPC